MKKRVKIAFKISLILFVAISIFCYSTISKQEVFVSRAESEYIPPLEGGYVPNAQTAIAIIEQVVKSHYDKEALDGSKPYEATLIADSVWIVESAARTTDTTINAKGDTVCTMLLGCELYAEIEKKRGTIFIVRVSK
jgi:hypothetical protein